jgi:kynureninase
MIVIFQFSTFKALMNSLSVNLHLLLLSFYRPKENRNIILIESGAFPSDFYLVSSHIELAGLNPDDCLVEVKPRDGELTLRNDDILQKIAKLGDRLSLVMFPGVQYYTGQVFQMEEITKAAHNVGAYCGLDLGLVRYF